MERPQHLMTEGDCSPSAHPETSGNDFKDIIMDAPNIDTLGVNADPAVFALHLESGACLTTEVIARRIDDRGGGLARVDGRVRLVEGLALPREDDEFKLSYYNTNSTWVHIDQLLAVFGLTRAQLSNAAAVTAAVRAVAARVPTYITIKDVKKRWGHGQEDIFPVAQWEKLWVDMTALPEDLHPDVRAALLKRGIDFLWALQRDALYSGWERTTIVTTGTASGKSLCYFVPIIGCCAPGAAREAQRSASFPTSTPSCRH